MGKKKTLEISPGLVSIPELDETLPEGDPLFMDYCAQVVGCASRQASRGKSCEGCRGREKCGLYFDQVSELSSQKKLTPDRHQNYLKRFLQLMNSAVL